MFLIKNTNFALKMLKISISLVFLMFTIASSSDTAPVIVQDEGLLDGAVNTQNKVMMKMSKEEFELVVDAASKLGECLIFFIEDALSMQDIHSKDEKGTPYVHFTEAFKIKKSKFFPRVVEPYNYLKNRFQPFDFNTFYVSSTSTKLRLEESFKFIYVFFEDSANETRTQRLRRHDAIMQEVFFVVKQLAKGPVVSFYTGKNVRDNSAHTQQLLSTTTPSLLDHLVVKCSNSTFQFDAEMFHDDDIPSYLKVDKCKYITEENNHWTYQITLEYIMEHEQPVVYELRFLFSHDTLKGQSGWKLIKVEYLSPDNEKLKTVSLNITNAWNVIYKSKQPLVLKPDDKFGNQPTLNIEKYTINLFKPELSLRTKEGMQQMQKEPITIVKKAHVKEITPAPQPRGFRYSRRHKKRQKGRKHTNRHNIIYGEPPPATFLTTDLHEFPEVFLSDVLATCFLIIFIMLMILTLGVVMIMGVCTNSIYDNVEQKALFIPESGTD